MRTAKRPVPIPAIQLILGLVVLPWEAPGQDYTLELMAQTGATFNTIDSFVGINDEGICALTGRDSANISKGFTVSSQGGTLTVVPVTFGSSSRDFLGASISNAYPPQFASRDRFVGAAATSYFIRRWRADGSTTNTVVGRSTTLPGCSPTFESATFAVDVADNDIVAFTGLVNGATDTRLFSGSLCPPLTIGTFPGNLILRPQVSNDLKIVYRNDLGAIFVADLPNSQTIAGPQAGSPPPPPVGGFTTTCEKPGVSQSGVAITWIGNRGNGEGVFVSVPVGSTRQTFALVGDGAPEGFSDFDEVHRVGVTTSGDTASSPLVTVVFVGTRNGVQGVYAIDASIHTGTSPPILKKSRIYTVARVGDVIGGRMISGSTLYDPINRCGQIAFRVGFFDGGQGVVRATRGPFPARRVRVSAKRVHPNAGGAANPYWDCQTEEVVRKASIILSGEAGVELVVEEVVDIQDPGLAPGLFNVSTNDLGTIEAAAKAAPAQYAWRTDALNVYFVNTILNPGGPPGSVVAGTCSLPVPGNPCPGFNNTDIVIIQPVECTFSAPANPMRVAEVLAHEIGHYFNLLHPFETCTGAEDPPPWPTGTMPNTTASHAPNACDSGDLVADTPTDPLNLSNPTSNAVATLNNWVQQGFYTATQFDTVFQNLMSYYCATISNPALSILTLTDGQRYRLHQAIELFRGSVLIPDGSGTSQSLGPGCGGPLGHPLLRLVPPAAPNVGATVTVELDRGSPGLPGYIYASLPPPAPTTIPIACCAVHLDLMAYIPVFQLTTNSVGHFSVPVTLASGPGIVGAQLVLQAALFGGVGLPGLDLTNGLLITIGS